MLDMNATDTADATVQTLHFKDDGATPNSRFPVLLYRLQLNPSQDCASAFEALFKKAQRTSRRWRESLPCPTPHKTRSTARVAP